MSEIRTIDDLNKKFSTSDSTILEVPEKLTPLQRLTGVMATTLLAIFIIMVMVSIANWDGTKDGNYSDLWEYTKITGSTIIGAVVATYLQTNNT